MEQLMCKDVEKFVNDIIGQYDLRADSPKDAIISLAKSILDEQKIQYTIKLFNKDTICGYEIHTSILVENAIFVIIETRYSKANPYYVKVNDELQVVCYRWNNPYTAKITFECSMPEMYCAKMNPLWSSYIWKGNKTFKLV